MNEVYFPVASPCVVSHVLAYVHFILLHVNVCAEHTSYNAITSGMLYKVSGSGVSKPILTGLLSVCD